MITIGDKTIRDVDGLSSAEEKRIIDFLQGAVYCWCKKCKEQWFSMRDLMGGDNRDWKPTPLQILYDKHIQNSKNSAEAFDLAGKESGWILKKVINDDHRNFETTKDDIRKYRWLQD
jgi:hypothetical protein